MVIWYTLTGIVGLLLAAVLIGRLATRKKSKKQEAAAPFTQNFFSRHLSRKRFRVGLLTPLANGSSLHLQQGVAQQLSSSPHAAYDISSFHGNNDRVTLFNQASKALESCDVIIPFGLACTNIAYEAARHSKSTTPIIFTGIKSHHIPLLRRQNPNEKLIGIISQRDHVTQINQLKALKPSIKNVLILYRQQLEWLSAQVEDMISYCETIGIHASQHLLPHGTHIDNQLGTIKALFDTIILMPHTLNAKGIQELITYCNIKGITLCANELDAVMLGAAIGFGGEEIMIGTRAGRAIRDVLEIEKDLKEDTIITHIDHYHVHLNSRTLSQQDVHLSTELLFLLNQGEITHAPYTASKTMPVSLPVGITPVVPTSSSSNSSKYRSSWRQAL